jgi:hypothetical protein
MTGRFYDSIPLPMRRFVMKKKHLGRVSGASEEVVPGVAEINQESGAAEINQETGEAEVTIGLPT